MPKIFKSKTIDFNILAPAIMGFIAAIGYPLPEPVMVGIMAVGNFILRLITKEPISAK